MSPSRRALLMFPLALSLLVGAVVAASSQAATDAKRETRATGEGAAGRVESHEFHHAGRTAAPTARGAKPTSPYDVYVPGGYKKKTTPALMVFLRGCASAPFNTMEPTDLNGVADDEGFLVLYPENAGECWGAALGEAESTQRGGGGDADLIAGMTLDTIQRYNVDPEQVYLLGGSAGGFQASATAVAYPDLYAAYGVIAGGGHGY